ncbi:9648_t:CDS:2 [Gigaspora rosea]|nr:9648_t:CDS:2 [Gigaspora rosea]
MWQAVTVSISKQEFTAQWNELLKCYESKPKVLKYLHDIWMPHKKHFVFVWTDHHLHLGNKVTSRVEAMHFALKRCLQTSVGDLESVHRKIMLLVETQAREIRAMISSQRITVQHIYRVPLFEPLLHRISGFALNKIRNDERLEARQALLPTDIHEHWWIQGRRIEFLEPMYLANSNHTDLQPLLQSLEQAYQFWPLHYQVTAYTQLEELVNTPPIVTAIKIGRE